MLFAYLRCCKLFTTAGELRDDASMVVLSIVVSRWLSSRKYWNLLEIFTKILIWFQASINLFFVHQSIVSWQSLILWRKKKCLKNPHNNKKSSTFKRIEIYLRNQNVYLKPIYLIWWRVKTKRIVLFYWKHTVYWIHGCKCLNSLVSI